MILQIINKNKNIKSEILKHLEYTFVEDLRCLLKL